MNIVRGVSFIFLGAALVFFATSIFGINGFTFLFLLLFSVIAFGLDYLGRKLALRRTGKIILALFALGTLVPTFAPVIQTSPSNGGASSVCGRNICSNITSWESISALYTCIGAAYSFDTLDGLQMTFSTGCRVPF